MSSVFKGGKGGMEQVTCVCVCVCDIFLLRHFSAHCAHNTNLHQHKGVENNGVVLCGVCVVVALAARLDVEDFLANKHKHQQHGKLVDGVAF